MKKGSKGLQKCKKNPSYKFVCIEMSLKTHFTVPFNAYNGPNTPLMVMVCDESQLSLFSWEI